MSLNILLILLLKKFTINTMKFLAGVGFLKTLSFHNLNYKYHLDTISRYLKLKNYFKGYED